MVMKEGNSVAAGSAGEGLAREACMRYPLVVYYINTQYINWLSSLCPLLLSL